MAKRIPKDKPQNEVSYLERLRFDPALLTSFPAKIIGNMRIVMLLVLTILVLGLVSYASLPKRLNPEVNIPIVTVITVLPGASPEDIESLITIPIENQVKSVKGLDTISSSSVENVSAVTLQFESSVSRDQALNDAQTLVDGVTGLPEDAQSPRVSALDFEDVPIWSFVITTTADDRSLMSFTQSLQDKIEELSVVDRVELSGFEEQMVAVTA
jgi:multidrug efflux pump subunit AcrB